MLSWGWGISYFGKLLPITSQLVGGGDGGLPSPTGFFSPLSILPEVKSLALTWVFRQNSMA